MPLSHALPRRSQSDPACENNLIRAGADAWAGADGDRASGLDDRVLVEIYVVGQRDLQHLAFPRVLVDVRGDEATNTP
jgi:hypothetical protein